MAEELGTGMQEQLDIFLDDHGDDNELKMTDESTGAHHVLAFAFNEVVADEVNVLNFVM